MKKLIKLTATVMSAAITAVSTLTTGISGSAAGEDLTVQYFKDNWSSIISAEQQKYPQTKNGKQCYWNGHNIESYTQTACDHDLYPNLENCNTIPQESHLDSKEMHWKWDSSTSVGRYGDYTFTGDYNCCMAFARKLQYDSFKTMSMARYDLSNGIYSLADGTKMLYYPQPGDVIRFEKDDADPERFPGHSIFVTGVSSNYQTITIGQVNAHDTCAIEWNSTTYGPRNENIDLTYIRCYARYFERPMIEGDINIDGEINYKDETIFKNTIMADGSTYYGCPLGLYDISHDGKVDMTDYYYIANRDTSNVHYFDKSRAVSTDWRDCGLTDSFCYNGLFYQKTGANSVTFVGTMDASKKNVTVPEKVKDNSTGTEYTVTEIGLASAREPRTSLIRDIESLTIPKTVTKIAEKALYNCNISRLTIPTGSKLRTIDKEAFAWSKVNQISFASATSLTTIGESAFRSCSSLRDFIAPYSLTTVEKEAFANCDKMLSFRTYTDSSGNCKLKLVGDNAFIGCTKLEVVDIENNLYYAIKLGTTTGIFDPACRSKLYLPNTNSVAGIVTINDSDYNLFRNKKMTVFAGKYKIRKPDYTVIVDKSSTTFEKVNF